MYCFMLYRVSSRIFFSGPHNKTAMEQTLLVDYQKPRLRGHPVITLVEDVRLEPSCLSLFSSVEVHSKQMNLVLGLNKI